MGNSELTSDMEAYSYQKEGSEANLNLQEKKKSKKGQVIHILKKLTQKQKE